MWNLGWTWMGNFWLSVLQPWLDLLMVPLTVRRFILYG